MSRPGLVIMLLAALAGPAGTQDDPWARHMQAAEGALVFGDLPRAEAELQMALELVQSAQEPSVRFESTLEKLAAVYEAMGQDDRAQPAYELLLAAREARLGHSSPELLPVLATVGRVALRGGDVASGEAHLRHYVELAAATDAADPAQEWRALHLLSRVEALQERHHEALALERRAVALMAADPDASVGDRARTLQALLELEIDHGSPTEIEPRLEEAAAGLAAAGEAENAAHLLLDSAAVSLDAGMPEMTGRLAAQALKHVSEGATAFTARRLLAEVSWLAVGLAGARPGAALSEGTDSPHLEQAAERLEDLLELDRSGLEETGRLAQTLSRLATVAAARGDAYTAVYAQRKLVEQLEHEEGEVLILALDDLASMLLATGNDDEALSVNSRLLALVDARPDWHATRMRPVIDRQVELLKRAGRKAEAKELRRRLGRE